MADEPTKPFTDPGNVAETYADNLLFAEVRHGLVHLTFGVLRRRERASLRQKGDPLTEEVVVARLVLAPDAVGQIAHYVNNSLVIQDKNAVVGPKVTN